MGEVVEMKRLFKAQVRRFGYTFRAEYRAGRTRELSDRQAAIYVDDKLTTWLRVDYASDCWNEMYFQPVDSDIRIVTPGMLDLPPTITNEDDEVFLHEAEMYIVGLLNADLATQLAKGMDEPEQVEEQQSVIDISITPLDRGRRVAEIWHNNEHRAGLLPCLIATEIYDALDVMGYALAETLDEAEVTRSQCGDLIKHLVATAFKGWHSKDPMHENEEDDNEKTQRDDE